MRHLYHTRTYWYNLLAFVALLFTLPALAQTERLGIIKDVLTTNTANAVNSPLAPPAANLDQGKNGAYTARIDPMEWVNGNLNPQQSHYVEGQSVAYRLVMTDMPLNTEVTLTLGFDLVNNSKYAIDFLTHYQQLQPHNFTTHSDEETVIPSPGAPTSSMTITTPQHLQTGIVGGLEGVQNAFNEWERIKNIQGDGQMALWGANFNMGYGVTYTYNDNGVIITPAEALDLTRGETKVEFTIKFTPTSSTVILGWGGHIARRQDWGISPIRSAGGISGSPYHMRTIDWSLNNLGNQDRSLQIALAAPICPTDLPLTPAITLCANSSFVNQTSCPASVCPGSTQYFAIPAASGATGYDWELVNASAGTVIVGADNTSTLTVTAGACGQYTVRVTLSNESGINVICEQTINIVDVTPPTITCPANVNLATCNAPVPPANIADVTASDMCGSGASGAPVVTHVGDVVNLVGCVETTTRTYMATDGCGNTATCAQTITRTVDVTPPVFTGSYADVNLGCNPAASAITASLGSATATDACGTPTVGQSDGSVQSNGCNRWQIRTFTATDGCGNTATVARRVNWIHDVTPPTYSNNPPVTIEADCGTAFPDLPWVAPNWTDACGSVTITSDVTTPNSQQYDCPSVYTRTWNVTDACGNTASFSQTISVPCCTVCTYTQGYFGNPGGQACDGTEDDPNVPGNQNLHSTHYTITTALNNPPHNGTMTLGSNGRLVIVTSSNTDVNNVIKYLPGGGQSFVLNTGNTSISSTDFKNWYTRNNKIKNTLLAQTMTLGINLGIRNTLGSVPLIAGQYLVTADPQNCGAEEFNECEWMWNPNTLTWQLQYSPYHNYMVDEDIVAFLGANNDVAGLFALANRALGGDTAGFGAAGISLSSIAAQVDMINNIFDECQLFLGYSPTEIECETPPPPTDRITRNSVKVEDVRESLTDNVLKLQVNAAPNPYSDKVKFLIQTPISGEGSLEVYNILGQKLQTVYKGYFMAGKNHSIDYLVPQANRTSLIYIVRIGDQQVTGKLLNAK